MGGNEAGNRNNFEVEEKVIIKWPAIVADKQESYFKADRRVYSMSAICR